MRSHPKATAAILTGAVALAGAAYGLGTQVGDGSASAASEDASGDRPARDRFCAPGLDGLADELGVDEAKLRDALRDARTQAQRDAEERRDDFVNFLAERLGVSEEKVERALPEPPALGRGHLPRPPLGP